MAKQVIYTAEQVMNMVSNLNTTIKNRNLYHNSLGTEDFNALIQECCKGIPKSSRSYARYFMAENSETTTYVEQDTSIRLPGKGHRNEYFLFKNPIPWRVLFHVIQQIQKFERSARKNKGRKESKDSKTFTLEEVVNYLVSDKNCKVTTPDPITFKTLKEGIAYILDKKNGYSVTQPTIKELGINDIESLT